MVLFRVPSGNENYLLVASCSADRRDIRMQPFQVQYSTSESTLEAGSSFPFPTSSLPHWVTQLNHFYVLFLPLVAHFPIMQHLPTCSPRSRNHHRCSCSDQSAAGLRVCPTHVLAGSPCAAPRSILIPSPSLFR
jgi:hypothetical protein